MNEYMKHVLEIIQGKVENNQALIELDRNPSVDELGEFKFGDGKDKDGLPLAHPIYVRKRCNDCYGRGCVIQTSHGPRRYITCGCVHAGYVRTRKLFEESLKQSMASYTGPDAEREDKIKRMAELIIQELFHEQQG
jgi:hypothetical protein